ncbi:MAG: hypothetical protein LQ345_003401 [Seirophora villosa]|nr:MAG: hypothetical protein LQ345_003401 [Seirophora villosa]
MGLFLRGNLNRTLLAITVLLCNLSHLSLGIQLNIDDEASIKAATKQVAEDLMVFYTGDQPGDTPGNLPDPYYWWQCGAMFGSLFDYYFYTGDDQFNDAVVEGMLHQVGPYNDYMTPNQTRTTGNDDQGFWALSAMSAAEQKFPNPPADKPQWLALAQAVFNTQAQRWDTQFCGGGLRWQIFSFNVGYDYKNTISNGVFFNLAARLAAYTGNQTYADWAEKAWDWTTAVGQMSPDYHFYDGAHTGENCTDINRIQWTYQPGVYLLGAAVMYNIDVKTEDQKWRTHVDGILNTTERFFSLPSDPNVMVETACEPYGTCNTDNYSFKAYLARWMAATTKMAPWTYDAVMEMIRPSAAAAALQCSGGPNGRMCGTKWSESKWDGTTGVGQQMSALEVMQSLLVSRVSAPVTNSTGGISVGDPAAGSGPTFNPDLPQGEIQHRDRVGAGFLTTLIILSGIGSVWWMIS